MAGEAGGERERWVKERELGIDVDGHGESHWASFGM